MSEKLRLDKWLWAARSYKTRSLATDEVGKGRVQVNGHNARPAHEVKVDDTVIIRQGPVTRTVTVRSLSAMRGAAPVAQQLYEETAENLQLRALDTEQRRLAGEPAHAIENGRPTKRDRRDIQKIHRTWDNRWSASSDT